MRGGPVLLWRARLCVLVVADGRPAHDGDSCCERALIPDSSLRLHDPNLCGPDDPLVQLVPRLGHHRHRPRLLRHL